MFLFSVGTLDNVTAWFLKNYHLCRQQDIFALFQTCAVLNYQSNTLTELYKKLQPNLIQAETSSPSEWLDIVWSLVLLNFANAQQISSVLDGPFVKLIVGEKFRATQKLLTQLFFFLDLNSSAFAAKLKLLNIDAYAGVLLENYNGPRLETLHDLQLTRSKEKEQLAAVVLDTLKNLMAEWCLQSNVNTRMGFLLGKQK